MSAYKLWLPKTGDYLESEGDVSFVARTVEEAWEIVHERWDEHGCWMDWAERERERWIHPMIASGRVLYKRDIDAEDPSLHEGAEAGDTSFSWLDDKDRELRSNEVRVWSCGAASPHWSMSPPWRYRQWQVQVGDGEPVRCADADEAERVRLGLVAACVEAWKTAHPEYRDVASAERYFA